MGMGRVGTKIEAGNLYLVRNRRNYCNLMYKNIPPLQVQNKYSILNNLIFKILMQ